jgi:predicted nucleic acid-binding protein
VILVDTNVPLDVLTDDPVWYGWSSSRLEAGLGSGGLLINDIVYAELAVRFERPENIDLFIQEAGLEHRSIPRPALFLAAKAFSAYRRRGGLRTGVLPDFFIGPHASTDRLPLLTRDAIEPISRTLNS